MDNFEKNHAVDDILHVYLEDPNSHVGLMSHQ
jgi:hypothetical protein